MAVHFAVPKTGTGKYELLLERCKDLNPVPTAVAHPCDATSLSGALEAAQKRLIEPILVGPRSKIQSAADAAGIDLKNIEVIDAPHSVAAAAKAVALLREAKAELLMKG